MTAAIALAPTADTATVECRHGHTGFCWDDATPEQRAAFDFAYGHAYQWAEGGDRDVAEEYAAYYAGVYYADIADGEDTPSHPVEFHRWLARTTAA
jgi:hypothetical protein